MEYFATGEGVTYEIHFCYAYSKKEAIKKHLDRFYGNDVAAKNYFKPGVYAYKSDSKKCQDLICNVFAEGGNIYRNINSAGMDFQFRFHYNHS